MINKNKRILWLLNHKTLLRFEVPMLRSLGFEVYMPKIIPNDVSIFRSGATDYSYDSSLTIPSDVLNAFNSFDFYSDWPQDITFFVNSYFGTAFTIPLYYPVKEVLTKFNGQIILRAFGVQKELTYEGILHVQLGEQVFTWLQQIKNRFWFGQGYEQLNECESSFFKERSLFLPISLHKDFWINENTWHGTKKLILFVCPNINDGNIYYSNVYENFKREFGDLPHIIVGQQGNPVNDPHVVGYVSDDELLELYKKCAVLYYHSQEPRHLHYSPIEAAIVGTPVVFYKNSLLGRMLKEDIAGAAHNQVESRSLVERLLQGDVRLADQIRTQQKAIPALFTHNYCEPIWRKSLLSAPFSSALPVGEKTYFLGTETPTYGLRHPPP